jgi:hypothetical protein
MTQFYTPFGVNIKIKLDSFVFYSLKLRYKKSSLDFNTLKEINKLGCRIIEKNDYVTISLLSYSQPINEIIIQKLKKCVTQKKTMKL